MGKILVVTVPVEGHFNPFLSLLIKLKQNGHEVLCLAGRKFQMKVEDTGATFVPPPLKWDASIKDTYVVFPELKNKSGLAQFKLYLKLVMFSSVPDTLKLLRDQIDAFQPDILVSDTFLVVGSWVTEFYTLKSVRISVVPLTLPGKNIPPFGFGLLPAKSWMARSRNTVLKLLFDKLIFKDVQKYRDEIRKSIGLPPASKNMITREFEKTNLYLHTSIPGFEYPREEFPSNFRFIGPLKTKTDIQFKQPAWWPELKNGLPVVLINQGTVAKDYGDLILPAIEALKDEKILLIAVPVQEGDIPNLPDNVHTEPYLPFSNLLPYVDLFITNGGFGGTQNALSYGIPIIVAGATEDKMEVAARLAYSGAGINLRKQKPSPRDIKNAYKKILTNPSYKGKAKELQKEYGKYDASSLAVCLIEEQLGGKP